MKPRWNAQLFAEKGFEGKHDLEFNVENIRAESALEAIKLAKELVRKTYPGIEFDRMQAWRVPDDDSERS